MLEGRSTNPLISSVESKGQNETVPCSSLPGGSGPDCNYELFILHMKRKMEKTKLLLQLQGFERDKSCIRDIQALRQEADEVEELVEELQHLVTLRKEQLSELQTLQKEQEKCYGRLQHMFKNIPSFTDRKINVADESFLPVAENEKVFTRVQKSLSMDSLQPHPERGQSLLPKINLLMQEELKSVPMYVKSRTSCDQVNAVILQINIALAAKYSCLRQGNGARFKSQISHYQKQETKETTGHVFFVEDDLRKHSKLKVDRRFYSVLNILRHNIRLREVRGGGLVRYVLV
uniref:spindle and kinetochore-associated protein 1 n=1 Tax=Myxine glutinosa TaxID=7769 RepID=UPI00358F5BC3